MSLKDEEKMNARRDKFFSSVCFSLSLSLPPKLHGSLTILSRFLVERSQLPQPKKGKKA